MLESVKDVLRSVGATSVCYARRLGDSTSALARRVGPRRGAIALGAIAAGVGAAFLIRYVRARRAAAALEADEPGATFSTDVTPIPANAPFGPSLA